MISGGYSNRVGLDFVGTNNSAMMMNGGVQQMGMGTGGSGGGFIGNSSVRIPVFRCSECSILKSSTEELEVINQ